MFCMRRSMLFLTNGSCLAPSYSPDGVAGGHKFTALKPVFILDGKSEGGVCFDQ